VTKEHLCLRHNISMTPNQNGKLALALSTRLPHSAPRPAIVRFPSLGGFAHWIPHSPSTTTTANLPSHQPSRWPRNAPELCSAPTLATYVITFPPWQCRVWSSVFRSRIFESGPVEGSWSTRRIRRCDYTARHESRLQGSATGLRRDLRWTRKSRGRKFGHLMDPGTKLRSPT
jgi:hypothetical protein